MAVLFPNSADKVTDALKRQWAYNQQLRAASQRHAAILLSGINSGRTPEEAYREFDTRTSKPLDPVGEFSTLARAVGVAKSVDLGRKVVDYRKSSSQTGGNSSLTGQHGTTGDQSAFTYAGTVVPIHDHGIIIDWREGLAMQADGFDYLMDNMEQADLVVKRTENNYLWNGDAKLKFKDRVWLGIKNDPSVVQTTTALDFTAGATTAEQAYAEIIRLGDILRITNNCDSYSLAVSREIMSKWQSPYSVSDAGFGSLLDMIRTIVGIREVYEDPALSGGQELAFIKFDQMAFHGVSGMAMATYMKQRFNHNDNYEWIKWSALGFLSRQDFSGKKCAMYVQAE